MTQRPNAPSPNTFSFEFFLLLLFYFFWKILESLFIYFCVWNFLKYIHEQSTSNATWIFRIQRNIETWNKQTNFKLNHDVANQMWSEAKLGHLLLLGPFRMLETGYAWTLIMIFWYLLEMAWAYTWKACILWAFGLWCWSCVYTFDGLKCWALANSRNKFGLPYQVEFNHWAWVHS